MVDTADVTTTDSSADAAEAQTDPADRADDSGAAHGGNALEEEPEPSVEAVLSTAASTDDDEEVEG